jgi:transposase
MSLTFPIRACWMKRNQQLRLPAAPEQRAYLHLIGAYNWRTDTAHCLPVERKNSQSFIEFLEYLLIECYPTQSVVLVLDNASYHHSAATRAALSLFEHRLLIIWLPVYSPDLNLIERFWRHLKDLACANKLYLTLDSLWENVQRILAAQNNPSSPLHMAFSKDFQ